VTTCSEEVAIIAKTACQERLALTSNLSRIPTTSGSAADRASAASHGTCSHGRGVSAEAHCADFHKPPLSEDDLLADVLLMGGVDDEGHRCGVLDCHADGLIDGDLAGCAASWFGASDELA
jgi:hypothetical protein